jgi:ABC-type Zn uptake system ZnuABC Zn-binding protein ZnuA
MHKRLLYVVVLAIASIGIGILIKTRIQSISSDEHKKSVCTTGMIADVVRQIVQDRLTVIV